MSALIPLFLDVTVALPKVSFHRARRYTLTDGLNSMPELVIEVFSTDPLLDLSELVGQPVTVLLDEPAIAQLDGIVRHAEQRSLDIAGASVYALTIVPRLWLTTRRSGHRIFQNSTALGIVADVFAAYGAAMPRPEGVIFRRELAVHEYRVQWGETDHEFLSRILSEEGLVAGWSPNAAGERVWTITDDTTAGGPDMEVPYDAASGALAATVPHVSAVAVRAGLCVSEVKVRDYDYQKPAFTLERRSVAAERLEVEDALARYGFAVGGFTDEQGGDGLAGIRLEEARVGSRTCRWEASFAMRAGMKVRLHDHPREDANGDFLVVRVWSEVDLSSRKHVAEVVPAGQAWRPAVQAKPRIHGTQTAFVVGAPGKEIDLDDQGRVEVEFRWDTRDLHRAGASRRVRVATPWAGVDRGIWMPPRVGDEVVVAYTDGDPDRPLVVGSVNNAVARPAAPVENHPTQSWWKSRSSPNSAGYNAIFMEDLSGKELLALRAQRDFHCDTSRNSLTTVGGAASIAVVQGQSTQVGGDVTTTVKGSYELRAGSVEIHSKGDINFNANGARNDSSEQYHFISSPAVNVNGKELVQLTAPAIVLKAGGSSIEMTDAGIVITSAGPVEVQGAIVKLNC